MKDTIFAILVALLLFMGGRIVGKHSGFGAGYGMMKFRGGEKVGMIERKGDEKMDYVGKTFLFDYGTDQYRVTYTSSDKMDREALAGQFKGQKDSVTMQVNEIRPGVYFMSWKETDGTIEAEVVDFKMGVAHTVDVVSGNMIHSTAKIKKE